MELLWLKARNLERRSMPAMPRVNGKAKKIAYAILGVPANMKGKQSKTLNDIDRKSIRESVMRQKGYTH